MLGAISSADSAHGDDSLPKAMTAENSSRRVANGGNADYKIGNSTFIDLDTRRTTVLSALDASTALRYI